MHDSPFPKWNCIHTIVFDFDGVFTDNKVLVDQHGVESVVCDRGDGLAFDLLRKAIVDRQWDVDYFILSKEQNPVVSVRAEKLSVRCVQGISEKSQYLSTYLAVKKRSESGMLYVGNDLNDLRPMRLAGYSVAPSDAHILIQRCASHVLPQKGGNGFVRAVIEKLIGIEKMSVDELISSELV